jgi:hypothetical protein
VGEEYVVGLGSGFHHVGFDLALEPHDKIFRGRRHERTVAKNFVEVLVIDLFDHRTHDFFYGPEIHDHAGVGTHTTDKRHLQDGVVAMFPSAFAGMIGEAVSVTEFKLLCHPHSFLAWYDVLFLVFSGFGGCREPDAPDSLHLDGGWCG